MALSGLDIYKLLAKTNCKKCGFQTCLAFAMQLAKKAVSLEKCPFVTPDVRAVLEEAAQPAIRLVEIGLADNKVCVGHETVLFRHEEKFYHPTAIGLLVEGDTDEAGLKKILEEINSLSFERVGQVLNVNLIALREKSGKAEQFIKCLDQLTKNSSLGLVLMCANATTLKRALQACAQNKPLVYCAVSEQILEFAAACKEYRLPLAIRGHGTDDFSRCSKQIVGAGVPDIVLDIGAAGATECVWQLTQIRRLAIKKAERSLGYPTMVVIQEADQAKMVVQAALCLAKYASIILLKSRRPEQILPLLTLRQNIFTDPQKPLQVEPNIYPIGAVQEDSPVLVTTNFSLTYYTVLGEIESSRVPSYLLVVDTEGMSVLTAWAAEKFTPEKITDTLAKFKLSELVRHKNLVIPGYVSVMSGELEEKSGWKIHVGPREAASIPSFLKNLSS
ncbi:MAG: acetyl-CoA decarbonylase/synthase complex subunit gamma [Candidatus Omnitrophota bacterium]